MRHKIKYVLLILSMAIFLNGCNTKAGDIEQNDNIQGGIEMKFDQLDLPVQGEEIAVIKTNHGDIKIRLFPEIAPKAV